MRPGGGAAAGAAAAAARQPQLRLRLPAAAAVSAPPAAPVRCKLWCAYQGEGYGALHGSCAWWVQGEGQGRGKLLVSFPVLGFRAPQINTVANDSVTLCANRVSM